MKNLKQYFLVIVAFSLFIGLTACDKCKNENPRARVFNNGTKFASVQIKTSGGNTENINNIAPGTVSDLRSYAPGVVTFTIVVDKDDYVKSVAMSECFDYDIAIDANNNVTTTSIDRND